MRPSPDRLLDAALAEWRRWGSAAWNLATGRKSTTYHRDDGKTFADYVRQTCCLPVVGDPAKLPTIQAIQADSHPWSAVTISCFFRAAGYAKAEFRFPEAHRAFLRAAVRDRTKGDGIRPVPGLPAA